MFGKTEGGYQDNFTRKYLGIELANEDNRSSGIAGKGK